MRVRDLETYVAAWDLTPDGAPFRTRTSWLLPVISAGTPAMLKLPHEAEERAGMAVLAWYGGVGAARVLRADANAVLMERLAADVSLVTVAEHDDAAGTRILCDVIAALHRRHTPPPPPVISMRQRFESLADAAATPGPHRPIFERAQAVAERLVGAPAPHVVLHGDVHHENVLHDPARGWVAIDPKGVLGNRAFDYAAIFYNPTAALALQPGQLRARAAIIAEVAGFPIGDVLAWAFAGAALSACWSIESGESAATALAVAAIAEAESAA
jgi:streptomycin 6-kinase